MNKYVGTTTAGTDSVTLQVCYSSKIYHINLLTLDVV